MTNPARHLYEFGPFRLDPAERILLRAGQPVPLTLKAFDLLLALVENSGHIVEKEALLKAVWPDSFVEEGVLSVNVFKLRKALGENEGLKFIETVPKRGYRFVAEVKTVYATPPPPIAPAPRTDQTITSIAVLPFKSLGADSSDDYLGLGLADALITRLSNIPRLVVRPTSAVRKYAGLAQDAQAVASDLMVESVLEGSLRRSGERLRVTVQLISAHAGAPLWAEKFDEQFTDIFAVEDSISAQVAHALLRQLSGEEERRLAKRQTANAEAYLLYLKGRYFWNKRTEAGLRKGIEFFQQALETDPQYALAWAGIADSYLLGANIRPPREEMPKAKAAALRALELDDTLAEAHASLGRIKMFFDWDWTGAESEFKRALELNPNYATARQWFANYLIAVGRAQEAVAEINLAQELDPLSLVINTARGWVCYFAREYDQALEQYQRVLEMDPSFVQAQREIGMVYERKGMVAEALAATQQAISLGGENAIVLTLLGRFYAVAGQRDEAEQVIARLNALASTRYTPPMLFAPIYAALGEREQALDWLERAYEDRSSPLVWLKVDPWFDDLRDDPRFADLLLRVGLQP
jgi:TolB-like protein/Flp pilus assembly protein TadD